MKIRKLSATKLQSAGSATLRSGLALNLLWIGLLKFEDFEVENIRPLTSSSPLFTWPLRMLGEQRLARAIGVTEIVMASAIAAKPVAPRVSALGSLGAAGAFLTTLSFLVTTPEAWRGGLGIRKLSPAGQFLIKDTVLLGASLLAAAESLQAARRRR